MRIALTVDPEIPVPPVHYGGIERIVDMLARGLVERGHDVTLFAHPASTCPVALIGWPGSKSRGLTDTLRNSSILWKEVRKGRFDIIHSCSRIAYLTPMLFSSIPKIMNYHRRVSPLTTRLGHYLSLGSLEFSAVSWSMIRGRHLPGRWHVVPNCVPINSYKFREAVADDAPLIFLGRIEEIKGVHLAVEAAKRSEQSLIIAGNIPQDKVEWFRSQIAPSLDENRIRYIGPVNDSEKSDLLGRAKALLMPTLADEAFGLVIAEAMACGTPVIGFRNGAVSEVINDGVTGYVVNNVEEMSEAVAKINDICRYACRERVEKQYSEAAIVDGYLAVYDQMIASAISKTFVA